MRWFTASELGKPSCTSRSGANPYGPGSYIPHSIYANVGRNLTGEAVFRSRDPVRHRRGIPATFPTREIL